MEQYYQAGQQIMGLEFYLPSGHKTGRKYPAIIFFYGGGFARRNLEDFRPHCRYFASRGYVCVNADYRLLSETGDLKECYRDGERALGRVEELADLYGIDIGRICLCGSSSGGALACHSAMKHPEVSSLVLMAPGLAWQYRSVEYLGKPESAMSDIIAQEAVRHEDWEQAYYLLDDHPLPPTLIMVGTADEVCYRGCALFHQKALDRGLDSTLVLLEGLSHGQLGFERSEDNFGYLQSVKRMEEYLNRLN